MGYVVIVAEKPSQARAYADAFTVKKKEKNYIELAKSKMFPQGAFITWAVGHLVELVEPKAYDKKWDRWSLKNLPILPERFEHKVSYKTREQFQTIKRLVERADVDVLINACDAEREGSNIFHSIIQLTQAKHKPVKRLWLSSLEVDEVRKAFHHLQDDMRDKRMYHEAKTRQISDWLVGMNGSRLYTLLLQERGFGSYLPIGRVQSPTVYLIYAREQAIRNFVVETFYELEALFTAKHGEYKGKAKIKTTKREEVLALIKQHGLTNPDEGIVTKVTNVIKKVAPPKLHALSTLQTAANRRFNYSPSKTLQLAQSLYDKKYISYPRTDSQVITPSEYDYLVAHFADYSAVLGITASPENRRSHKRFVQANAGEHYAIIPTKKMPKLAGMNKDERNIYEEIIRSVVAMFLPYYEYEETTLMTAIKNVPFKTVGKTEKVVGWHEVYPTKTKDVLLPQVTEGEQVAAVPAITEGQTTPPKPYTEGDLITMMKTAGKQIEDEEEAELLKQVEGIGTEATRAGIIETIKRHEYVRVQKNIVTLTPKGQLLCQAIEGTLLASPSMTAKWEKYLHKIGEGEGSPQVFLQTIGKFIEQMLIDVPPHIAKLEFDATQFPKKKSAYEPIARCPKCQQGQIQFKQKFYGCTRYKEGCDQTFPLYIASKKLTETMVKALCEKGKTAKLKGFTAKNKKKFDAVLVLQDGKITFEF
ncbi:type IA DNA topoisomerase [Metalysinibacillus jejuensis]|uniref:type IA DNA topoisomerase n=1 Tax=Metalysinibacillus jejuensis TaxID=914327 RepID=UPI000D38292F|nr:type IA DNA topoisomerase [Metalysinibacillus jejuensis]